MKVNKSLLQLTLVAGATSTYAYCYWCGQCLRECGMCKGSGTFKDQECKPCKGKGSLCPVHEGDW